MDRPLLTIPCHPPKALHCPYISTKAKPTTCWWASPLQMEPRRKQMAQGEAHLPTGHSKVTVPLGCRPPPSQRW